MDELENALRTCVRRGTLEIIDGRRIRGPSAQEMYANRLKRDSLERGNVVVRQEDVRELAEVLARKLTRLADPTTRKIGNGLFLLRGGGATKDMHPTTEEFARAMIKASMLIGSRKVSETVEGWASGKPIKFKNKALIQGIEVTERIEREEGIILEPANVSHEEGTMLPEGLPEDLGWASKRAKTVISVEYSASPALYGVGNDEEELTETPSSGAIRHLDMRQVCDCLALGCNQYVGIVAGWRDLGELGAFYGSGTGHHMRTTRIGIAREVTQREVGEGIRIMKVRSDRQATDGALEVAIERWMKAKRRLSLEDELIELRVAIESLFAAGSEGEKAFRVAMYGAWSQGTTKEERQRIYKTIKATYSQASQVIHGGCVKRNREEVKALVSRTEDICRRAIVQWIERSGRAEWNDVVFG